MKANVDQATVVPHEGERKLALHALGISKILERHREWLESHGEAGVQADLSRENLEGVEADLLIAVDCGDESRMGNVGKQARVLKTPAINLDHHWSNTNFADVNLVNSEWVSASEGVLDWLDAMQWPISATTAQ